MTDNYQFLKSSVAQGLNKYTPYTDKQFNFINDICNGVYTNTSQSLIQHDLSSIFNSSKLTDTSDHFLVIPTCSVAAFTDNANALVAPVAGDNALLTLKTNSASVIHQVDLAINGKTTDQVQPYHNILCGWWMASQMSVNDLREIGRTIGWSSVLDSASSGYYSNKSVAVAGKSVPGIFNNKPYATAASSDVQLIVGAQNAGCVNRAIQEKLQWTVDSANGANNFYPSLVTATQLANEFKPYYTVINNYMVWYDYLIIRMKDLLDSMNNIGLTRRFDAILRIYVNTGLLTVGVDTPNNANCSLIFNSQNSTFTNTCPITINNLGTLIPAGTTNITAGFFIARPANYTMTATNVNLNNSGASNLMTACRYYYSQIIVNPAQQIEYLESNKAKKVVYRSFIYNQYNNIGAGASFSALVQSGVTNILGVAIMPFVSANNSTYNGANPPVATGPIGFYQWQSPFDPCGGCAFPPLSITNLQVAIGGVNVFQNTMFYTWQEYLEQVSLFDKLSIGDFGMSAGLVSQNWWEANRVYWVDCSRCNSDDRNTPRNVNISFNNNSNVAMDLLVFVLYLDELVIDVNTGIIKK
jgi:hypothetical protein